jgi:phospholipid N-methyltransferase
MKCEDCNCCEILHHHHFNSLKQIMEYLGPSDALLFLSSILDEMVNEAQIANAPANADFLHHCSHRYKDLAAVIFRDMQERVSDDLEQ